jgi:drug/metabolite transporter (DMT)-like permease
LSRRISRAQLAAHPEALATALLLATVAIWGSTPQVTDVGASYARPFTLTMLRALPTAVVLLAGLPLLRFRLPVGRAAWLLTAVGGVLMVTIFLGGFTEGVSRAGPGNAIVMSSTTPFWVALLSRAFYGERISLRTAGGLLLGFAGIVIVFSSQLGSNGGAGRTVAGLAFALAAALGWAFGTIVVKEQLTRAPESDLRGIVAGQYLVGGLVLLAISMAAEGSSGTRWSSSNLWLSAAYISLVGSAFATVLYFAALRIVSPTRATTWSFLSPLVAILIGIGLGTVPKPLVFVGMALTIVGVYAVNRSRRARPAAASEGAIALEPAVGEASSAGS